MCSKGCNLCLEHDIFVVVQWPNPYFGALLLIPGPLCVVSLATFTNEILMSSEGASRAKGLHVLLSVYEIAAMSALSRSILVFLSWLMDASPTSASEALGQFLLTTLERGQKNEYAADNSRFLKPVPIIKMLKFASENTKRSKTAVQRIHAAEGARYVFERMLAVAADSSDAIDLQHILSYPLKYPFLWPIVMGHPWRQRKQFWQGCLNGKMKKLC